MIELPLMDLFHDKVKLLKLFWIAFWVSLVFLTIGYAIIIRNLLG